MSEKKVNAAAFFFFTLALIGVVAAWYTVKDKGFAQSGAEQKYESTVFGQNVVQIDIVTDENTWQSILDNALEEQYTAVSVTINGKTYDNVGISPKGNSTLTRVASSDSDRFSFKIKFDEYIDDMTLDGLDVLVLNNIIDDNSYIKEYIAFDMMNYLGVPSSLYTYASLSLNGENIGFYLALEGYNDSFEMRNFGTEEGEMYSAKSMEMGGDMGGGRDNADMPQRSDREQTESSEAAVETVANRADKGGMMGGRGSSSGTDLVYTDDEIDSYSGLFDNAVGSDATDEDKMRVIEAIKALNSGENLEQYLDVDEILKYLAVHTVVVNLDSYSSNMCQNYYIYEREGQISVLPWDYGLSFGGMNSGSVSDVVNFPIDTPVSGVEMSERPLISVILGIEEYRERYHEYLRILCDEYLSETAVENKIASLRAYVDEYVAADPTAFCTYEEYQTAIETMEQILVLRGESISGQLDGTVPSTEEEQQQNPDALIDTGDLNLSDLGSMSGGRGGMGGRQDFAQRPTDGEFTPPDMTGENTDTTEDQSGDTGENSAQSQRPTDGNFTPPDMTDETSDTTENQSGDTETGENSEQFQRPTDGEFTPPDITGEDGESFTPPDMGSMPNRFGNQDQTAQSGAAAIYQQYQIPIMLAVTVIVMVFSLIFAYRFGRKRR